MAAGLSQLLPIFNSIIRYPNLKGVQPFMAKKEFQAESKRLLDMMINSIYTQREIF